MRKVRQALLVAVGAALSGGFAPAPAPVALDGHLPPRTEVSYRFGCASGPIDIAFSEQLAPAAPAERYRTLQLLRMAVSGRSISPAGVTEVSTLLGSYERIEEVRAECGAGGKASVHVRGLRKADWQAHIAALEAHDGAPEGTARPERPDGFTTTIIVEPSGQVAIRG
ncbi:MAG TPA: hypothetical protein VD846_03000 [Allosphingosinicella sp.]|nr:hypothetical protein [Allosphingosinicella sp.]